MRDPSNRSRRRRLSNSEKGRSRRLRAILAAVATLAITVAGPASPANADAVGNTLTDSGPTINILGQSVTIPYGIARVEVIGDGRYLEKVVVAYLGDPASDIQVSWDLRDSGGNVVYTSDTYDSGSEAQPAYGESWEPGWEASDSGTLCGHVTILGAPAGTACVEITDGTNWTFWN